MKNMDKKNIAISALAKGFDKHCVRYFDKTECKYDGDGVEELIIQCETYNPVIPNANSYVWIGMERYVVTDIDYSPEGNASATDNSVMIDISLAKCPLLDPEEIDEAEIFTENCHPCYTSIYADKVDVNNYC